MSVALDEASALSIASAQYRLTAMRPAPNIRESLAVGSLGYRMVADTKSRESSQRREDLKSRGVFVCPPIPEGPPS
jgi:hypothetical protein